MTLIGRAFTPVAFAQIFPFKEYLRRYAWSVFFVRGKLPAGKWKAFQSRRPTEKELHRMFEWKNLTGLAVVLGEASGDLWARDFDDAEAYPRWAAAFPDVACKAPTVATARGFHVYGVWAGVTFAVLGDGELRAGGGCYNLLPPTEHPSGPVYSWRLPPGAAILRLDPATCGLDKTWGGVKQTTQTIQKTQEPSGIERGRTSAEQAGAVPDELLMRTIPDSPSRNHRALFDLARRVRGLEVAQGAAYSMTALHEALVAWYEANPHVRDGQTWADYWEEFLEGYERVRVPFGTAGTLDTTWEAALVADPPPEAARYGDALGILAAWCRELQRLAGGRAFYLGARTVQARLELPAPLSAWRRLKLLCRLGVLEQVEAGDRHRASSFRYKLPLGP